MHCRPGRRRLDLLLALGAPLALLAVLFRDAIFRGRVLFDRDLHLLWYAQAQTFVRCVAAGSWPVWNPHPALGQPLLALPNNEAAYPFTWLNLLLTPGPYYTLFALVHLLAAAAGAYALARRVPLSRAGAGAAALVWCASGPLLCLVNEWNQLAGMAFLPWTFVAADRAGERRRAADAFLWGLALAGSLLAGSPEAAAMGGLGSALYALRHLVGREAGARDRARLAGLAVLAVLFAAGLAAVQWLPTLEVAARSARGRLDPAARAFWSVHPLGLADAVLPLFLHQWPLSAGARAALFESRDPFLVSLYLGLPALGLVVASASGARTATWRLLAAIGAAAVVVALGRHTPAFAVVGWLLPPVRALRYPVKAMTLAALCWAVLAGGGVDAWRGGRLSPPLRRAVVAAMTVAAVVAGGLAALTAWGTEWWGPRLLAPALAPLPLLLRPVAVRLLVTAVAAAAVAALAAASGRERVARAAAVAAALAAVGDLAWAHRGLNPTAPAAFYAYRSPVAAAILAEPHGRVYTFDYFVHGAARKHLGRDAGFIFAHPQQWPYAWSGALALRTYPFPPVIAAWGLESGFERDPTALYSPHAMELAVRLRDVEGTPAHTRLLRLGGVTHVVSLHAAGLEDLEPAGVFEGPFPEPIRLFRVPAPLPRAVAVGSARVADGTAALDAVVDERFDPQREVVLAEGPVPAPAPGFEGSARVLERRPDRVRIEARLSADGWVVLLDGYDPGWSARVDGRDARVRRADVGFRAVAVPAGAHVVEMAYRPRSLVAGLALSALALAAGLVSTARRPGRAGSRPRET